MAWKAAAILASGLGLRPGHLDANSEWAASVSAAPSAPLRSKPWNAQARLGQGALAAALCLAGPSGAECLALGDLGYVLPVEGEVTVTQEPGRPGLLLDFAPGGRAPKTIWLYSLDGIALTGATAPENEELPNGLVANYRTKVGEAGGSGGAEVMLSGWLEGEVPLGVACSTQQEYPSPEWCLPILGTLRAKADGCEMKED